MYIGVSIEMKKIIVDKEKLVSLHYYDRNIIPRILIES